MGARREAREALAAAGLRPRKRWGQHFLCDPSVARRIVDTAELGPRSVVLEIGPGLGALTEALAARAGRLYLVEIDPGLATRLAELHAGNPRVRVVEGDVLALPLAELVCEPSVTVVANLPYNVATPVLFRLLDLRVPRPDVDSAVVDIRWSVRPRAEVGDVELFRDVVRAAFGQRRKMLRNALAALAARRGLAAEAVFARAAIAPTARAETLDLGAFARLARAFA